MIVRVIDVYVKDGTETQFRQASEKNHAASVEEPGVLRFDVLEDDNDPLHFVLYEAYRSDKATLEHKKTPHYAEWKSAVETMMAKPRTSVTCTPVAPVAESNW